MGDISRKGHSPILRQGFATGGMARSARKAADSFVERVGGSEKGKPHSTKEGRIASGIRKISRFLRSGPKKTWPPKHSDLLRRFPKVPQPHKSPGDTPHIPNPRGKPGEKREYQPAAKGGRMGFKNGKSVFRRNPDRLEFTGKHGAKGAIPWNRKFKKRLSISDSPRQPKMLQPFKNGGSSMPEHYLQHGYGPHKKRKGKAIGGPAARGAQKSANRFLERVGGGEKGKPHSTKEGRIASGKRKLSRLLQRYSDKSNYKNPRRKFPPEKPTWSDMPRKPLEKGKYQPLKKGGKSDKKWIQKATASIKKRKTKGKCTPITKPGCTGRAKALAKTFKKMAKKRKAA